VSRRATSVPSFYFRFILFEFRSALGLILVKFLKVSFIRGSYFIDSRLIRGDLTCVLLPVYKRRPSRFPPRIKYIRKPATSA
jgi:hypothetical protein